MSKSVKKVASSKAGPKNPRAFDKIKKGLTEALVHTTALNLAETARRAGVHHARAELAAPIIANLHRVASTAKNTQPHNTPLPAAVLSSTACSVILACLAEAGYRHQPAETDQALCMAWVPVERKDSDQATTDAKKAA